MSRVIELRFESVVAADRPQVWERVSTMAGVNDELRPLVRMTFPADRDRLPDEVPTGEVLFGSWLLAFGVLPFDRHALALERIEGGFGFAEESTSWLQRRWRHERSLTDADGGGCHIVDRLVIEPRVGLVRPMTEALVRRLFDHRHRRLVRRFGPAPSGS